jgi:hypothetical protein
MKTSHYTTPRSMSEGVWLYDADPIECPDHQPFSLDLFIYASIIVGLIALGVRYV